MARINNDGKLQVEVGLCIEGSESVSIWATEKVFPAKETKDLNGNIKSYPDRIGFTVSGKLVIDGTEYMLSGNLVPVTREKATPKLLSLSPAQKALREKFLR